MYHEDWLVRQIQITVRAMARIIFNKEAVTYEMADEIQHTDSDLLYVRLVDLLEDDNINKAENILFENMKPGDLNYLLLGLDFYARVNELDNDTLSKCDFSREEIVSGLSELKTMFGVTF